MKPDNIYYIMDSVSRSFNSYIDDAMYAGLAEMRTLLPFVLVPFILVSLWLMYFGEVKTRLFVMQGGKLAIATMLIVGSGYVTYVHDFWLTDVGNLVARGINGSGTDITTTQLFYNTAVAIENLESAGLMVTTGALQIVDRGIIEIAAGLAKAILGVSFIVFQAVSLVTVLAVAVGAWMLCFLLYDATRGWVFNILGTIVSLSCWKLAMLIVVKVMISRMGAQIRLTDGLAATTEISGRISQLGNVCVTALACVILMMVAGKVTAVGGGFAASAVGSAVMGAAPAAMAGMSREIGRLASNIGKMGKAR